MQERTTRGSKMINMITKRPLFRAGLILLLAGALSSTGCAYFINRGNDLVDVFDVGITVSEKPQIGLYASWLNLVPVGYSNFDGTLIGLADRNVGAVKAREKAAGVLVWGYEQFGYEDFNVNDPESPPQWGVGLAGLAEGPLPPAGQTANCPKLLHLGFIGLSINCKVGQLVDFILGWTTLDVMGDDKAE